MFISRFRFERHSSLENGERKKKWAAIFYTLSDPGWKMNPNYSGLPNPHLSSFNAMLDYRAGSWRENTAEIEGIRSFSLKLDIFFRGLLSLQTCTGSDGPNTRGIDMSSGRSEEEASANPNVEYIHLSLRARPGDSIIWVSLAGELDPES